uniref:Uncharacterized protein n=1 Tax=Rhizophora mucronata TaxID=61149 RepID=A0A2P2M0D6_RHIMU
MLTGSHNKNNLSAKSGIRLRMSNSSRDPPCESLWMHLWENLTKFQWNEIGRQEHDLKQHKMW